MAVSASLSYRKDITVDVWCEVQLATSLFTTFKTCLLTDLKISVVLKLIRSLKIKGQRQPLDRLWTKCHHRVKLYTFILLLMSAQLGLRFRCIVLTTWAASYSAVPWNSNYAMLVMIHDTHAQACEHREMWEHPQTWNANNECMTL